MDWNTSYARQDKKELIARPFIPVSKSSPRHHAKHFNMYVIKLASWSVNVILGADIIMCIFSSALHVRELHALRLNIYCYNETSLESLLRLSFCSVVSFFFFLKCWC